MKKVKTKILIIEDEPSLLEMYKMRFEKDGYNALIADNADSGIKTAKKEKPDLIILDILMSEATGFDVIEAIRNYKQIHKTPILVFSNLDQPEQINRALRMGANDYVIKTDVTPSELVEKVKRMLSFNKGEKQKKRILIIGSKKELAKKYQSALAEKNFVVEVVDKGMRGLRLASYGDFDLILLDMTLSAFDGYEGLKQLKHDLRTEKVPIFVFSNSSQEQDISQALKMGAEKYFVKSKTKSEQVMQEIEKIL